MNRVADRFLGCQWKLVRDTYGFAIRKKNKTRSGEQLSGLVMDYDPGPGGVGSGSKKQKNS
jgi:hypothetical protein